jgi:hypothetical protein
MCINPDSAVNDRANGVWGYPTPDVLQLSPFALNPSYWAVTFGNRGVPEKWVINVLNSTPIAWTVEAPDGSRWQSNWQLVP